MAGSVGEALAQGIERGMGLGFQMQDRERADRRERAAEEERQRRATIEDQRHQDTQLRQERADQWKLLNDQHGDLLAQVTAAQQAGQPVAPELASQINANATARRQHLETVLAPRLARDRQNSMDFISRLQSGEVDLDSVPGAELYRHLSLTTGRTPQQLQTAAMGAKQAMQGFETRNQQMTLQGVNQLLDADLRAGIGEPSPKGGEIVGKQIVQLLPAQDANGTAHPDKVIPVVRVYVRQPGAGPAMENGATGYYDAPLTEDRSTGPDSLTKVIDLKRAFEYAGQMGTLAAMLQDPRMAAKLDEGAREVGQQTQADVDAMQALGRGKLKLDDLMWAQLTPEQRQQAAGVKYGLTAKAAPTAAGTQNMQARLAEIDAMEADGSITPEQADRMRTAQVSGVRSATGLDYVATGKLPVKPAKVGGLGGGKPSNRYDTDENYRAAVDHWAEVIAAGGKLPPGTGRDKDFVRDVNVAVPKFSGGAREQLSNAAEYGGAAAGARSVGTRAANFELAKSEAYTMADLVTQASAAVPRTGFIPINKAIVAFEKNSGDTNVRQFGAAINSFINAYARAVSPIGSPTVSDKNHAREMLSTADSHQQVVAIIAQLKREMEAAGRAPEIVREKQRAAVAGGLPTTGVRGSTPRGPAPGTVDGGYRFKGGNPADKANWEKVQ